MHCIFRHCLFLFSSQCLVEPPLSTQNKPHTVWYGAVWWTGVDCRGFAASFGCRRALSEPCTVFSATVYFSFPRSAWSNHHYPHKTSPIPFGMGLFGGRGWIAADSRRASAVAERLANHALYFPPLSISLFLAVLGRTTTIHTKQAPCHLAWGCLVDGGGFEPPKAKLTDLQSVPFGHSGTRPYW